MNIRSRSATAASGGLRFLLRALRPAASRNATRFAAGALGLASLLGPAKAEAAILVTNAPVVTANNSVSMEVSATNNDTGAVYNSAELNVFKDLATQLYALPANQTQYNSISDLMSDWNFNIRAFPTGDVYAGWNFQKQNDGSISLSNESLTGGEPGTDYDLWNSNPGSNKQAYTLIVPNSQLNFDGVAGYDPLKAGIVLSGIEQPNMFIGTMDMDNIFRASGQSYQLIIPEPKTYAALFGSLALGLALIRRKRRAEPASR